MTPQSSADPTMADSEAGNSNTSLAQEEATKVTSKLLTLAVKTVNEHNESLRPFPELIKKEKGENKVKELERIKHLKYKIIKSIDRIHWCTKEKSGRGTQKVQ